VTAAQVDGQTGFQGAAQFEAKGSNYRGKSDADLVAMGMHATAAFTKPGPTEAA
jgi:hypothetical protein